MHKKKVLVCGTPESLQKFFADAVAHEFEVVAAFTEVKTIPPFAFKLIDGIIFTDTASSKGLVKFALKIGLEPRKIILWDAQEGWGNINFPDADGTPTAYLCGLEFHIRNDADKKFFAQILSWLQNQWRIKNLSPELYPAVLSQTFQSINDKPLDFDNVRTFTEKLQWIKIFDATPLKSRLADKFLVRNWVAEKIGEQYLIPLLGVWDDFDDIDFDALPNQFVLKCNHGSAMNIIVRDKKTFNRQQARDKLNAWLAIDFSTMHLELHYTRINRKIIAEKFMLDGDAADLTDYKFWCFNGTPTYCKCMTERTTDLRIDYFDMNWTHMNFEQSNRPNSDNPEKISRPKNFELMKTLAAQLSEDFAFVRVDFYEINGKVYFGEMTFTPAAGNILYKSEGTNELLGSLLKLPEPTLPPNLY